MLTRDSQNGMLWGVCAGLAKHLNVNVVWIRLATILGLVLTGPIMAVIYVIMAIVLPQE